MSNEIKTGVQKPFIVANVRELFELYDNDTISFSRMVEMLNRLAATFYQSIPPTPPVEEGSSVEEAAKEFLQSINPSLDKIFDSTDVAIIGQSIISSFIAGTSYAAQQTAKYRETLERIININPTVNHGWGIARIKEIARTAL